MCVESSGDGGLSVQAGAITADGDAEAVNSMRDSEVEAGDGDPAAPGSAHDGAAEAVASRAGSDFAVPIVQSHYAVLTAAASPRPSSAMATSRILNFWILPVTVMGNWSVIFQ